MVGNHGHAGAAGAVRPSRNEGRDVDRAPRPPSAAPTRRAGRGEAGLAG